MSGKVRGLIMRPTIDVVGDDKKPVFTISLDEDGEIIVDSNYPRWNHAQAILDAVTQFVGYIEQNRSVLEDDDSAG